MTALGWSQLVMAVVAIGILTASLGIALVSDAVIGRLREVAPRPRFAVLTLIALFPAFAGLGALAIAFAPSVLDALSLVDDHCAYHAGHDFHLCFVHGSPPAVSPAIVAVGLGMLLWVGSAWFAELRRAGRSARWARRLDRLSRHDAASGSWTFDSERSLAFSVGLFRPRVFVSRGLRERLSDAQFRAVVAHENAHVRRRDALVKMVVRLVARFHPPAVRRRLLEELQLAAEQACDERAAETVGDRLVVAEAILAVERTDSLPSSALGFGASGVERRVRAMVDDDWKPLSWPSFAAVTIAGVALLGAYYDELHHLAETLLSPLF